MNTRPNQPNKTEYLPRARRCGKPLSTSNLLVRMAIVVSAGLFGIALALDADAFRRDKPVAAPVPAAVNSAPKQLSLDNVPVSKLDGSTSSPAGVHRAPVESIWQLDEPTVITANVTDSVGRATVVPVTAIRPQTTIRQRTLEKTMAAPLSERLPAGKSHVWKPVQESSAGTSTTSGMARVTRSGSAVVSNGSATGRANVSRPAPAERRQPKSGQAHVSSPYSVVKQKPLPLKQHLENLYAPVLTIDSRSIPTTRSIKQGPQNRTSPKPTPPAAPKVSKRDPAKKTVGKQHAAGRSRLGAIIGNLFNKNATRRTPTATAVAPLETKKNKPEIQLLPEKQVPTWELSKSKTATTAEKIEKIEKIASGTDAVATVAQADQPEPVPVPVQVPVPKDNVPPSPPVPGTTETPDTLEYAGFKPIGELTVDINVVKGEDPPDVAGPEFEKVEAVVLDTEWIDQTLSAPIYAFYHQPLYFEDANAERCGKTWGILQPAVSAAQFYLTIPALPYLIGALPPNETVESLGDCSWGCKFRYRDAYLPPLSLKGAALQGATVTGLIFLIP